MGSCLHSYIINKNHQIPSLIVCYKQSDQIIIIKNHLRMVVEDQIQAWCRFEALGDQSLLIGETFCLTGVLTVSIILGIWILKKKKQRQPYSKIEKFIAAGTIVWILSEITKTAINFYTYEHIVKHIEEKDMKSYADSLTFLSICFWFLDYLTSFVLVGWLFLIPSSWIKEIFLRVDDRKIVFKERVQIHRIFVLLKFLNYYFYIRFFFLLFPLIVGLVYISGTYVDESISYGTYIINLIQSSVLIVLYSLGLMAVRKFRNLLNFSKNSMKTFVLEYVCLMVVCLFRTLYNIIINIFFSQSQFNKFCSTNANPVSTGIAIIVGIFTMHLIPLYLMFYIYWPPSEEEESIGSSLL